MPGKGGDIKGGVSAKVAATISWSQFSSILKTIKRTHVHTMNLETVNDSHMESSYKKSMVNICYFAKELGLPICLSY